MSKGKRRQRTDTIICANCKQEVLQLNKKSNHLRSKFCSRRCLYESRMKIKPDQFQQVVFDYYQEKATLSSVAKKWNAGITTIYKILKQCEVPTRYCGPKPSADNDR